ncbi:2'-5' RNA ligase family protein [Corynebacterium breve]|uniref:2'-5' RNA ligase family protein n=1 Tax=Corynebacterium breve TaxID=3049799 RepID=A0ABY8VHT8_9CORY|nr:2'-5' RNA ligase family protein [Corynebacterium breve]WIM68526.1 2'-5' RNA ligase family protein [Corynebacterium breve]
MSPDNILLRLPEEQDAYIRQVFAELHARGLPQQNQTPHITVTFSPRMDQVVVDKAKELLPALMPSTMARVGVVVFGTKSKQTIAWLLEADPLLEEAARELSALNPDGRGRRWTPHLTVGLRIPRGIVPEYMKALDEVTSGHFKEVTAERAVLWRPNIQELTELG